MSSREMPTLDEIAAGPCDQPPFPTNLDMVLARELLALRAGMQQGEEYAMGCFHAHRNRLDNHRDLMDDVLTRLTALESERAVGDGCTCGVRPDVPRGPNHGAGCPMEVSEASMQILRGMLSHAQEHRRSETQRAETAERERDEMGAAWLALKAQRDRLEVYLRTAQEPHRPGCHIHDEPYECTCGLAAALASVTPAEGGAG